AMLAMAEVFAEANDKESRYFSSIMALLMTAPSRGSEPFKLPTNCLQWEADDNGEQQMLFRWRAAKGKGAMKKWSVAPMH
ncbi:integrase, partial [Leclercia adecarboxylata]|nr:integrase [Leclercia adecarboxylata]